MKIILALFCLVGIINAQGNSGGEEKKPEFSTAGFFQTENTGRKVESLNVAWRFHKGEIKDAQEKNFDDKNWEVVNIPNGIEHMPMNASGCSNYQGIVWYRKYFTPNKNLKGKKVFIYFEGVMGKCKVYLNGEFLKEHFGGYLPFSVDATNKLELGKKNVIAVMADNQDDQTYPPGKTQTQLDFTYFGGIYRDVFLVSHNKIFITDPNFENSVAGGGVFIATEKLTEKSATIIAKVEVKNESNAEENISVEYNLSGKKVTTKSQLLKPNQTIVFTEKIEINNPKTWSPDYPNLNNLFITVKKGVNDIDGYRKRIGIKIAEFKGKEGFFLNGKPYGKPIIGGNRHQDFAIIGNAVPNSLHYRDAKKMKDAGMDVVRNAHCPQDPAFLDACDELGLLVINNNPGWQFWNKAPIFGERVKNDIRQLVRRDRNHGCIWFWEPVLNETHFPKNEAKVWNEIIYQEFPYPFCYTANDFNAAGAEFFPILFPHPVARAAESQGAKLHQLDNPLENKNYFTREWGDCVDNWNSHNSPSRVHLAWGEAAQLVQANHYANPKDYKVTSFNSIFSLPPQFVGGTLWHTFDHQRGYHPDSFYGGIFDAFRMPKYSAEMFKSQKDPKISGANIFIAHEMTPFSPKDVTIFSNCDKIKLTVYYGDDNQKTYEYERNVGQTGIRYPIIVFKDAYSFWHDKTAGKFQGNVNMKAEGFINEKLEATHIIKPARRAEKILLFLDNENVALRADGSDMVTVVAVIADKNGNIKRLNEDFVEFSIEGEGRLIGDAKSLANPKKFEWGKAPILVQSTNNPGKIKITAKLLFPGKQKALSSTLEFNSISAELSQIFDKGDAKRIGERSEKKSQQKIKQSDAGKEIERLQKELNDLKLKEVEKQQDHFGEF